MNSFRFKTSSSEYTSTILPTAFSSFFDNNWATFELEMSLIALLENKCGSFLMTSAILLTYCIKVLKELIFRKIMVTYIIINENASHVRLRVSRVRCINVNKVMVVYLQASF